MTTMKNKLFYTGLIVLSLAALVSCDEILDQLDLTFESGPHSVNFDIQPLDKGMSFASYDVIFHDIEKEIEANGGSMDQLDKVVPKKATIQITSGANNFDAFEMVEVYISTELVAQKKIGWINTIPLGVSVLTPDLTSDNLKEYLQEGEFTLTVKGVVREDVTEVVFLYGEITFDVNL